MAVKRYSNGEVTVVWKPDVCIHSGNCVKGLPDVFRAGESPWIKVEGSSTERIIEQVRKCPSGALSFYLDANNDKVPEINPEVLIEATSNGPLLVHGTIKIKDRDGNECVKNNITALCRCGGSGNKPYCDGTHRKNKFSDTK